MNNNKHPSFHLFLLLLFFFFFLLQTPPSSAIDFVINSFNSTVISLYGNATIQSNILTLTNSSAVQIGRALYPTKIPTKNSSSLLPFSTSFIFAMAPTRNVLPGHGFVFLFTPVTGILNANAAQNLGLFSRTVDGNSSNHVFEDEMYVGFTAATGALIQSHNIISWSFSNSNFSLSDALITEGLPSFVLPGEPK